MKAAQIRQCSNNIRIPVKDIPVPEMGDDELLIQVKAAAVNPVDMLNLTGAVRLIQDDSMPLTPGNECAGIVEKAGRHVTRFQPGDRVYARLPVGSLGANGCSRCKALGLRVIVSSQINDALQRVAGA